ncbi:hypothetical protein G4B88_015343 [Cannabis sativa]|uniref:SAGA-associated factor 11 n=1 Tax=Cannabis sativa TaxID=3483 RepID=A0A7J6EC92_CANSA|nr:hypothetical protein G4B88_015343 [Cannabis sativa]
MLTYGAEYFFASQHHNGCSVMTIEEEAGHQKLAATLLYKELREADEPNFLDEEDMHVFGLKPMSDPLHLVCCNTCKRPVQASQYVAHAEFCRMVSSIEESMLDVTGSVGHRKAMRKEKRKPLNAYANQAILVREVERSKSIIVGDTVTAESRLNGKPGTNSSFTFDRKRNSAYGDAEHLMHGSAISPGDDDNSAGVMTRALKRSKLMAGEWLPLSDASVVSNILSTHDDYNCHISPKQTIAESGSPNDSIFGNKKPDQFNGCCLPIKVASTEEVCSGTANKKINDNVYQSQTSSQKDESLRQINTGLNSKDSLSLVSSQSPDQCLAQSSEMCLGSSEVSLPISMQFPVDNASRSMVSPVGLSRSKYVSKPFSYPGNSGQPLQAVQQQNGSVPVL